MFTFSQPDPDIRPGGRRPGGAAATRVGIVPVLVGGVTIAPAGAAAPWPPRAGNAVRGWWTFDR
ncbi:hypothetical protein [Catenulispora subtropica]|uniref:Uncharacterized protein n=1 Tax=Catenulispora subtropica TaxID=450798 RepID=A0ABN2RZF9_9ACTN